MTPRPDDLSLAGLPEGLEWRVAPLPRRRALGRGPHPATVAGDALAAALADDAADPDWHHQPLGGRVLQWAREQPGLYAAEAPALPCTVAHRWLGDGVGSDLVVDARHAPAWLLLLDEAELLAVYLQGPTVHHARVALSQWRLPRPPVEAWGLHDEPEALQEHVLADLQHPHLGRAVGLGRWLRHGDRRLAPPTDPLARVRPIRRWVRGLPVPLISDLEDRAVQLARRLQAPDDALEAQRLRDDLQNVRWMLRLHDAGCARLDDALAAP
jgi:hypothetical protein